MKNIIIDLTSLNEEESKMACQGIKLFNHKKEDVTLNIFGNKLNLVTISSLNNVVINDSKENENEDKIFSLLKKEESILLSFDNKNQLVKKITPFISPISSSPLFASFYPNAYTGNMTLLADLGYKPYPSVDDYFSYLKTSKEIVKKLRNIEKPTIKLLLPSGLVKTKEMKNIATKLKEDESYIGEIGTVDLLKADCDILLGDPAIIQATISGINQGVSIYDDYLQEGMKHSFQYKMGGFFIKKLMQTFSASIDKKITSGGMLLLGYERNVVLVRKDTTINGISSCLNLAYNLIK